jgi:hypothetical protein
MMPMDADTPIRERAYLLWQQAGCPDGRSEEFWFAALESIAADAAAGPADSLAPAATKSAARRAGAAVSSRTPTPAPAPAAATRLTSIKSKPSRADRVPT